MKIESAPDGFRIAFPGGGSGKIRIAEIHTIDIETLPTMSVDVDFVTLGYENGEHIEVSDEAEGFQGFLHPAFEGPLDQSTNPFPVSG